MHNKLEKPIFVTRSMAPDEEMFMNGVHEIFASRKFTNQGPFLGRLESELKSHLGLSQMSLCTNGTVALQLALRCANLAGKEVVTTPFTYVATLSSLLWENCVPVFCDIDEETLCMDPGLLPSLPCEDPAALMPVHIYGNACDIPAIEDFAEKNSATVIYDAAQAFGSTYEGKSLFSFGNFSTCSLHATKLFHTVEGGFIAFRNKDDDSKVRLMSSFGHIGDDHHILGINAKLSDLHALVGLSLLDRIEDVILDLQKKSSIYDAILPWGKLRKPLLRQKATSNYCYYPVIFEDEKKLLQVQSTLNAMNIFPRRYFYPSLTELPYLKHAAPCPIAEDIAKRVLCLPIYVELDTKIMELIGDTIKRIVRS